MRQRPTDPGLELCSVQGVPDQPVHRAQGVLRGSDQNEAESSSDGTYHRLQKILRDLGQELSDHQNPERILMEALRLVSGSRANQHGDYTKLQGRIAELWSAYLGVPVEDAQVAFCMTLLKVARDECGEYNKDDGEDATAYTALWAALTAKGR